MKGPFSEKAPPKTEGLKQIAWRVRILQRCSNEKAYCPLMDYRDVKIAYSPKTKEPYLAVGFDPCAKRRCETCSIRNEHLVVKLSDVLAVLDGEQ